MGLDDDRGSLQGVVCVRLMGPSLLDAWHVRYRGGARRIVMVAGLSYVDDACGNVGAPDGVYGS
jgi:hypothetical protein